jgi:hypothetical protein
MRGAVSIPLFYFIFLDGYIPHITAGVPKEFPQLPSPGSAIFYTVPKAFQVFIIYYEMSRYFLIYVEIICDILGSTATLYKTYIMKTERLLGQCSLHILLYVRHSHKNMFGWSINFTASCICSSCYRLQT